jgi:hypothetical protein
LLSYDSNRIDISHREMVDVHLITNKEGKICFYYEFLGYYNNLTNYTVETFGENNYLLALVFREELYRLKPKLYGLVERVFGNLWRHEINQLYITEIIDDDATIDDIDPSNLLKLITRRGDIFRGPTLHIKFFAEKVYEGRHLLFAHSPKLQLTTLQEIRLINQIDFIERLSLNIDDFLN